MLMKCIITILFLKKCNEAVCLVSNEEPHESGAFLLAYCLINHLILSKENK